MNIECGRVEGTIEDRLREKLNQEKCEFKQSEVIWLVERIGDPNPEVRDQLVYQLLSNGILNEHFTVDQYEWLKSSLLEKERYFYELPKIGEETLTRSFSVLLCAYFFIVDTDEKSIYYHSLQQQEKKQLFEAAIHYLRREKDYMGYSKKLGWVHAFAHGADFLAMAIVHPEFPEMKMKEVWESTISVFRRLMDAFQDGEERRLAKVVSTAVLEGKLKQEELAQWIEQMEWVREEESGELVDYYRYSAYENFLAAILIQLEAGKRLSSNLKRTLINQLENY